MFMCLEDEIETGMEAMKNYQKIIDCIGRTPLLKLCDNRNGALIWGKLEFFGPLGSVKDRPAWNIVRKALKDGLLHPGGTIIEATSGNMGIGLAMAAAAAGCRLVLTMPESMSVERRALIAHLGGKVVLTPAGDGMKGAIRKAEELAGSLTGAFLARQFENPANPEIHYRTTGPEIWEATEGKAEIFVAGVGTGGTITGVGRYLKEKNPRIKIVAVEPAASAVLSGGAPGRHDIQGIGAGFVPVNYDPFVVDEVVTVTDGEAIQTARELAQTCAVLCGISSGANVAAARRIAANLENHGKNIVTVICDTGERYLSTPLFKLPE